jgi:hypothetical protein
MIVERAWSRVWPGEKTKGHDKNENVEGKLKQEEVPREGKCDRLIEKLAAARGFLAIDQRDKVYAVMGLAVDGEEGAWKDLVSYAPEITPGEVYTRFARAMVQRGEGFEVLLQAGIGEGNLKVPTWVPVSGCLPRCVGEVQFGGKLTAGLGLVV